MMHKIRHRFISYPQSSILALTYACVVFAKKSHYVLVNSKQQVTSSLQRPARVHCFSSNSRIKQSCFVVDAFTVSHQQQTLGCRNPILSRRRGSAAFFSSTTSFFSEQEKAKQCINQPTSKWAFLPRKGEHGGNKTELIQNILVCGDGDLSFSADIAEELDSLSINLFATVLEDKTIHTEVYEFSTSNAKKIESYGHKVMFGVDATQLSTYFGTEGNVSSPILFDRIQFNFPHWRGKANNRYNRQLLSEFLQSASAVLSPNGEIHVALCEGQGGCSATTLQEWRGSWTASLYGAEHGLLLANTFPFDAQYRLSSHRGVDRPFHLGKDPTMHVFVKPGGAIAASRDIQLCCRHELHVVIPDDSGESAICFLDQILTGDAIENIIQSIVPEGIRVEVPARKILDFHETHEGNRIAVFLVVYCSERYPVTRSMAELWRVRAQIEVGKVIPLRQNRVGRTVSHPFPYPALHPEIKYQTTGLKT